jgi:hypothetical protein
VFVELIQHIFRASRLPTELSWSVVVLIPKGSVGCRGIGLLEVVWKVVSSIIDIQLKNAIQFHDSLHGFRTQRGTAAATIEVKLRMNLYQGQQQTLYQVFIDMKKAYNTLHRGRTLEILKGYGVGPKILAIICNFWSEHTVVVRQGGYHGEDLKAEQGVTQGDIPSPTMFNIIVD